MKKSSDNSPACVKQQTAMKLVERNWGIIASQENILVSLDPSYASNRFAFSLFSNLAQNDKSNVFFSPYSISNAFSMIYEGARGNTKSEIQSIFHFTESDLARRDSVKILDSELNNPNGTYKLDIANALWIQNDFTVLKNYTDTLEKYYAAKALNLDFKNKPEDSRQMINKWVENKTEQKIKDLLPPDSINDLTRVVLTNAIYFKGNWTNQFDGTQTREENFTTADQHIVKVSMMTTQSNFKYVLDKDLQVLEMPYQGGALSMIVLLPAENNLKPLTGSLSVERLNEWKSKLIPEQITVYMPKFTIDTKYILNDNLSFMGMPSAFSPNDADFTGITGKKDLYISTVVHQAFVKVDEKGTEAAAATGISLSATSAHLSSKVFKADHPFMFLIYDNQTGLVLFIGQMTNPS